jgi:FkbM family methyltransferase
MSDINTKTDSNGFIWYVPPYEYLILTSEHEGKFREHLETMFTDTTVAYDIGAHDGSWAIPLSKKFQTVYAFEPCIVNLAILKKNCELNDSKNIHIIEAAAWDEEKRITLVQTVPGNHASKIMAVNEYNEKEVVGVFEVSAITIDDFVRRATIPSFVKIDVEGNEETVLRGMKMVLELYHPILMIEIHMVESQLRIRKFLEQFDYVCIVSDTSPNEHNSLTEVYIYKT